MSNDVNNNDGGMTTTQGPASGGILDFVFSPLSWIFRARQTTINPDQETRLFLSGFDRKYSEQHPSFHGRSYIDAVRKAHRESKFLIVYLHAPLHEDTDKFCQQVLCRREVSDYCDRSAVTWAGQIWDTEAYALSQQLRVSTYPFVAVLMCRSEVEVEIVDRVQGKIEAGSLLNRFRNVMASFETHINTVRQTQQRQRADSLLREEQDREFREAEAQDRRNRERREQEMAEARVKEQEARLVEEREKAAEADRIANMERRKAELSEEPSAGTDIATVRFLLPNGSKVTRRFTKDTCIKTVHEWMEVHFYSIESTTSNFSLSTAHPKVELTGSHLTSTLEAAGLFPRGMLYVQDLDL